MALPTEKSTQGVIFPSFAQPVPHSVEAEQALLGALLLNNELFSAIDDFLLSLHFYIPAHGKVFDAIRSLMDKGQIADPVTLTDYFGGTDWFKELEGKTFLDKLTDNATTQINARSYGKIIHSRYQERQLIQIGSELSQAAAHNAESKTQASELISHTEQQLYSLAESGQTERSFQNLKNPLTSVLETAEIARKRGSDIIGTVTGFKDLDRLLGGLQKSDLIILAARPAMGKTSFALNIALNAAQAKHEQKQGGSGVAVFSLEMSSEQLASRLLSSAVGISAGDVQRGKIDNATFARLVEASDTLCSMPVFIDDTPQLTIDALRSRARRLKRTNDIGLIVIDYLQLLRGRTQTDNRVQEISEISMGLKALARELDVPVVALSQLSRSVENRDNKRPQLADLRESGSIEQDADIVMFLYREEYYLEKQIGADPAANAKYQEKLDQVRGLAELLISKNRKGATSVVQLVFDGPTTTFKDYADNHSYPRVGQL